MSEHYRVASPYTAEFKEQVVKYVLDNRPPLDRVPGSGPSRTEFMRQVSEKFQVNESTIYSWLPGSGMGRGAGHPRRRKEGPVIARGDMQDILREIERKIEELQKAAEAIRAML